MTIALYAAFLGIQSSRESSCLANYEGIRLAFIPFMPPPEQRTAKQRNDIRKFNNRIDYLKSNCERQISWHNPFLR